MAIHFILFGIKHICYLRTKYNKICDIRDKVPKGRSSAKRTIKCQKITPLYGGDCGFASGNIEWRENWLKKIERLGKQLK